MNNDFKNRQNELSNEPKIRQIEQRSKEYCIEKLLERRLMCAQ